MRSISVVIVACVGLAAASPGRAEHLRAHGEIAVARAVGGYQGRELSTGGAGLVQAEMPVLPWLGAELQLGVVLLGQGDAPRDPGVKPFDGASALTGSAGLRLRPLGSRPAAERAAGGLWCSGHAGATVTGGLFRPVVDVSVGYDIEVRRRSIAVGPALGLMHVFQGDGELRPDDANVLLVGVHGTYDSAPSITHDRDGDRIVDPNDRCPTDAEDRDGFEDADGCPDRDDDLDGILDGADHCPRVPEDVDGFEDADGCPDPDNDRDGIADARDRCPDVPEDVDGFEDADGCPDPDNDGDGIADGEDLCRNEPETKNGYADEDGCPDEADVRVVGERIVLDDRVHFEQNNAIIRSVSFPLLERLAKLLRDHPEYVHIEVQGHTDQKGTAEFNEKLSRDRAESVVGFLVGKSVDAGRLSAVGFGSNHLLVDKTTEHALFMNRRVEFVITRNPTPALPSNPVDPGSRAPSRDQRPGAEPGGETTR